SSSVVDVDVDVVGASSLVLVVASPVSLVVVPPASVVVAGSSAHAGRRAIAANRGARWGRDIATSISARRSDEDVAPSAPAPACSERMCSGLAGARAREGGRSRRLQV